MGPKSRKGLRQEASNQYQIYSASEYRIKHSVLDIPILNDFDSRDKQRLLLLILLIGTFWTVTLLALTL